MVITGKQLLIGGGAALLLAGTAAIASYETRNSMQPQAVATAPPQPAPQQHASGPPPCNDKNIVGTLAGGVAGGVLGNQVGRGSGKTVATVGGALGGAYLGNQYIPTRNVTCR